VVNTLIKLHGTVEEGMDTQRRGVGEETNAVRETEGQFKVRKAFNKNFFGVSWFCDADDAMRSV
jgi:hypothetical protein